MLGFTKWIKIRRYKGTKYKAFNTSLKHISSGLKHGKTDDKETLDINNKQDFHPTLLWWPWWMCLVIKRKHQYCITVLLQCSWHCWRVSTVAFVLKSGRCFSDSLSIAPRFSTWFHVTEQLQSTGAGFLLDRMKLEDVLDKLTFGAPAAKGQSSPQDLDRASPK